MSLLFEAGEFNGPQHEVFNRNIELPKDFGQFNCMAGSMAIAFNTLGQTELTEKYILENLPIPFNLQYMSLIGASVATECIARKNNLPIYWYQNEIKYNKREFINTITDRLKEGSLIHLIVDSDRWGKNVYAINGKFHSAHSVLVVGYEKYDNRFVLTVCDSMSASSRTISVDKVFRRVFGSDLGKINEFIHLETIPVGIFEKT